MEEVPFRMRFAKLRCIVRRDMLFFLKQYLKKWKTDRKKIREDLRENAVSAEEKERIAQLGERLGYLDREMQLRQLSLYESEFERMIQNAKETAPAKKKMYHSLGVFGGAMIAILFW